MLVASDLAEKYQAGTFPTDERLEELRMDAEKRFNALRRSIIWSFLQATLIIAAGLVAAMVLGKVLPTLRPDYGKVVTVVGAFLAGWGTLLQFHRPEESWKGTMLDEKVHLIVVRLLTIVGIVLALFGAVWWQ